MEKKIYISGMHSGQNPCPGVGIARSIRKAFPNIKIVGIDHWQGSSGLHDSSIDEALLFPLWNQIDNERHAKHIKSFLDAGNLWISGLDMEVHWLSENVGRHENLLAPSDEMLELTAKPALRAFDGLGFRVSEYIPASLPDSEIHEFLRHSSWQCWLKSPYHDARRVSSWPMFERAREALSLNWKTGRLFLQRHTVGNEESIVFAAYRGKLVVAAHMEKRLITPEGKTWAGRVSPLDPEFHEKFAEAIQRLGWSGGGEIEYLRDPDGHKWLIECNPRFPAWIFGGALAGINLPGRLVAHVWNLPLVESVPAFPGFTRVVQEIPAKESVGLPVPPDPTSMVWSVDGKKGKGGPVLGTMLAQLNESKEHDESGFAQTPEELPDALVAEVEQVAKTFALSFQRETPARVHLEKTTTARFEALVSSVRSANAKGLPKIQIGYSVKTCPTSEHLQKAKKFGFFAECISQLEVRRALGAGWKGKEVILNGPGKFWPITKAPFTGLHMLFCDSLEEFDRVLAIPDIARVIGLRMRHPKLPSRFGNSLDEFSAFQRLVAGVKKLKGRAEFGFHFHMPSWMIGVPRWMECLESLLTWCQAIEQLTDVPIRHLDLGGGFFPGDLENMEFARLQEAVGSALSNVTALYFEPGRSLTQDGEALVSRVIDVRKNIKGDVAEVVVDACIAELPLAQAYSHRIFYKPRIRPTENERSVLLKKGRTRVLGRICMEDDVLSYGLDLPHDVEIGDLVIFGDAGAYERSMSYAFGRGGAEAVS